MTRWWRGCWPWGPIWSSDIDGDTAMHWACMSNKASALALLIAAGAPLNACTISGSSPLITAAANGPTDCMALLLARGGDALELDAKDREGWTALHYAAYEDISESLSLLLQAGADPTIRNTDGETTLDIARSSCIPLLERALAEPQRPRTLLKARALLNASLVVPQAFQDARDKNLPMLEVQRAVIAAAPPYLQERIAWAQNLPLVTVQGDSEELVACVKYALGLEGGGGVHEGGGPRPQGMLCEVFVELCELLVPKWARVNM